MGLEIADPVRGLKALTAVHCERSKQDLQSAASSVCQALHVLMRLLHKEVSQSAYASSGAALLCSLNKGQDVQQLSRKSSARQGWNPRPVASTAQAQTSGRELSGSDSERILISEVMPSAEYSVSSDCQSSELRTPAGDQAANLFTSGSVSTWPLYTG